MKRSMHSILTATLLSFTTAATTVQAQAPTSQAPATGSADNAAAATCPAQQAIAQTAAQGKFSFIVFYRDETDLTRAMSQVVAAKTTARPDFAVATHVRITDPAEAPIVKQFDVSRAPMPLVLVTAPNGAITGAFPQRVTELQLDATFVTPAMSHCMKSMQAGKIVFLCLQTSPQAVLPAGVTEFLADPQFKDRADVVPVQAGDVAEAELLSELKLGVEPGQKNTVFFAPPGVMVGSFGQTSTKAEIAAALHKAGKCCDDPHCKHNHAAKPGPAAR